MSPVIHATFSISCDLLVYLGLFFLFCFSYLSCGLSKASYVFFSCYIIGKEDSTPLTTGSTLLELETLFSAFSTLLYSFIVFHSSC